MSDPTTLDAIGADGGSDEFPPFLNAENKQEIAAGQYPMWVVGGNAHKEGKFEPQTFFTVRFGANGKKTKIQTGEEITISAPGWAENSETWTLALTANDEREGQMKKILNALASGADYVGPVFLHAAETKAGNTYYRVRGTRDDQAATKQNGSKSDNDDSSIPF